MGNGQKWYEAKWVKWASFAVGVLVLTHQARSYIDDNDKVHADMDLVKFQVTNGKMNTLGQQFGHIQTNQQWIMKKMDGQDAGPAPLTD